MSKAKVFIKKSATIVMAFMFMLMTNVFVARAEEKSVDGVTVSITTDEESYTVGNEENATVTVTFTNTNPYEVTVDSAALTSSYFAVEDTTKIPSSITLAAKGSTDATKSFAVPMSYTFKQFVSNIEFHNFRTGETEKLTVGMVASLATVEEATAEFIVDCFDASEDEHADYFKLLDTQNVDHAVFFDLSLKNSKGTTKQLNGCAKIYLQVPTGWDAHELQAIFVSEKEDEQFIEKLETIDDVQYVTFITSHFSPYALFDPKNGVLTPTTPTSPKTGDASMKIVLPLVVSAVVFLTLCLLMGKKRRSAMLALVLCAGVSVYAVGVVAEKVSTDGSGDFSIGFNDFVKRESADSADTASVDAGLNVAYSVSYEGPTLADIVYDYDGSTDYYGGPFKIKISGGPEGWVGKLLVLDANGVEKSSHDVDFSSAALTKDANGNRWFKFDPEEGADNGDELDIGYTLTLEDAYGNNCYTVIIDGDTVADGE